VREREREREREKERERKRCVVCVCVCVCESMCVSVYAWVYDMDGCLVCMIWMFAPDTHQLTITHVRTHAHSTRGGKEERRGVLMLHKVLAGGGIVCVSLSVLGGTPALRALISSR